MAMATPQIGPTTASTEAAQVLADPTPIDDDIPEVPVPPEVLATSSPPLTTPMTPTVAAHSAVIQGALQALQGEMGKWMRDHDRGAGVAMEGLLEACKRWADTLGSANEHAAYQLSSALGQLQEKGLKLLSNPYMASVDALSPQGFAVKLTLVKTTPQELTAELAEMTAWLQAQSYTAAPNAIAF